MRDFHGVEVMFPDPCENARFSSQPAFKLLLPGINYSLGNVAVNEFKVIL